MTIELTDGETRVLQAALSYYKTKTAARGKLDSQKQGKNGAEMAELYKPYQRVIDFADRVLKKLEEES